MLDFNKAKKQRGEPRLPIDDVDLDDLSQRLAERARDWVPKLFPNGRIGIHDDELRVANINGDPARDQGSCIVKMTGPDAGCWYDHALQKGGKPLSTVSEREGIRGRELIERAQELAGVFTAPSPAAAPKPNTAVADTKVREVAYVRRGCVPAAGTLVQTYLASRGLDVPDCPDLQFHPECTDYAAKRSRPAMVAIVRRPDSGAETGGIHRTYLRDDGSGKADTVKPKMMLGPCGGGVVMLMPISADGEIGVGEGIETSLAAGKIFGVPVWAGLSAGGMRSMPFPPGLKRLTIFGDRGEGGENAAQHLLRRAEAAGIEARVIMPRSADDFADDLAQGLWKPGEEPLTTATQEPEIIPPAPSYDDLLAIAKEFSRETPTERVDAFLRMVALGQFPPVAQNRILGVVKTKIGSDMASLVKEIGTARRAVGNQARGLVRQPAYVGEMLLWDNGEPKALLWNALLALRRDDDWAGVLAFDDLTNQISVQTRTPYDLQINNNTFPRPWVDTDDLRGAEWMQQRGIPITPDIMHQAAKIVGGENRFHPVRDFLDDLIWDGVPRLDLWLTDHCGAIDSEYTRAVASRYMISAVARVYRPGAKVDCALILEGKQGLGKSSALRVLFDPWFTDEIADLGSKDSAMQLSGIWGVELAELDAMDRAEIRRIKAFISRTNDRYRPPYGKALIDVPRQSVFCGSINDSGYLRDPTGGRRFWPVRCSEKTIDVRALHKVREQLWAEATSRYHNGDAWFLYETHLAEAAFEEQSERYEGDAWDAPIAEWLNKTYPPSRPRAGHDIVRIGDILEQALYIEKGRWNRVDQIRVGKFLRFNGWERVLHRNKILGEGIKPREYVWRRGSDWKPDQTHKTKHGD